MNCFGQAKFQRVSDRAKEDLWLFLEGSKKLVCREIARDLVSLFHASDDKVRFLALMIGYTDLVSDFVIVPHEHQWDAIHGSSLLLSNTPERNIRVVFPRPLRLRY
jgi:hypothetical protein